MLRDFTKRQRKILDLVLRLSWGCGKKFAYIPLQRAFVVVGVYESDVGNEIDWLIESKIISRQDTFYWFNKDFDQWQISRVKPYQPKKLSELLRINLNGNCPKLSETLSQNLVKHEGKTSQNTKFPTPNLASPKEILNKSKENTPYSPPLEKGDDSQNKFDKGNYPQHRRQRRSREAPVDILEGAIDPEDPDKYIKGKYGHMVKR